MLLEIKKNFNDYFKRFIETCAGTNISAEKFEELQRKFGISTTEHLLNSKLSENYKIIIREAIADFEKDREDYQKIFCRELLEDYDEDADTFKSKILKNECPIIRKTLANRRAKELDKYRANFGREDADNLLEVVTRLCAFGEEYQKNYNPESYENITEYSDLKLELLDTEDYTVFGVIGGGIKTHMLYKVYPAVFSNRSRSALWALWYLSGKKAFGCKMDSEFLMIDKDKEIFQQNYFYPYELFSYYAFEIYSLLKEKAAEYKVSIDTDYRYVVVDAFFEYVAMEHDSAISFFKSQIRDGGIGIA